MNYVAQNRSPNPGAVLGALALPGLFGALLIAGLAVTYALPEPDGRTQGFILKPEPIEPEPLPEPTTPDTPSAPTQTTAPAPAPDVFDAPIVIATGPVIDASPMTNVSNELITLPLPSGTGDITGPPVPPLPEPIDATPRTNPGGWITERDYRARWIREGLSGVAGFTLQIDARGRVTDCTITRSTGHAVLDGATCRLLARRARFDPARDPERGKVAGSYSSSVAWTIP